MADWTSIPDATFDPDRPVLGSTHLAIVKNFEALAEGAANAPRVKSGALVNPAAAATHLICRLQSVETGMTITSYPNAGLNRFFSSAQHLGVMALVPGVIRCRVEHRTEIGAFNSLVRILKNGSQVIEWSTLSTSFIARSVDVTVAPGDQIIWQHRISATPGDTAFWRNLDVVSANPDFAVA
jgi:hypothetical protein